MQFKIDENLHSDTAEILRKHGHDAISVYEQGLQGESDQRIARVCREETRSLITLDLDFSDIRVYPPSDYNGIIVLRLGDQCRVSVLQVLGRIIPLLDTESLVGKLWIVDERQVRIRGTRQIGSE